MAKQTRWFAVLVGGLALAFGSTAIGDDAKLVFLHPKGGETWSVASVHRMRWKSSLPADATIKVEWWFKENWALLGENLPNSGEWLWQTPFETGAKTKLRLTASTGDSAVSEPFAIGPSQDDVVYEWKNVTMTAPWAPRDGAGALVYKDRLWMLGGWNPAQSTKRFFPRICNNEVWSSADGKDWVLEKDNTFKDKSFDPKSDWEGRHTAGYVVHQDKMWIVGGDVNQGYYQNDVWNSADGKKWTYVNPDKPVPWGPRSLHHTVAFKGKIWVIGGQTIPKFAKTDERFYRDIWTSENGVDWTKLEPKEPLWPQRGMIGGAVVHNDRIWILGGGTYETIERPQRLFHNDVWSSADGVEWTQHLEQAPWHPRQYHDVAVFDGRMWVMEGYHEKGGNRNDVWWSKDGVNWHEQRGTPWKPRHAAGAYVFQNSLWMIGGNNMEPDVWRLNGATKK